MAHTKGKWHVHPSNNGEIISIQQGGGVVHIADCIYRIDDVKLIAAAPDLLEACQIAVGQISRAPKPFTSDEIKEIIFNAIKKATL